MNWSELERRQPRLAELGRHRLLDPGVVLIATIRRDGTPRVSPVEPWIMDGALWLSMMWGSTKAADLLRDPRILVHNAVSSRDGQDGEFKLRGRSRDETDVGVQRRYAAEVAESLGWDPVPGRFHLFEVEFDDVSYVRYDGPTGDQYVTHWPPAREYVRRATSATSVGKPEPHSELLISEAA
ncbi:MAG: pyridoxamine 5'-phosphate oxidase family protein, partial [Streptosporangiaceae bacterium]